MTLLHPEADAESEWKSGTEPNMGSVAPQGPWFLGKCSFTKPHVLQGARGEAWQELRGWEARQLHAVTRSPALRWAHAWLCAILRFLIIFKQGTLHFHFAGGPKKYVACPVVTILLTGYQQQLKVNRQVQGWTISLGCDIKQKALCLCLACKIVKRDRPSRTTLAIFLPFSKDVPILKTDQIVPTVLVWFSSSTKDPPFSLS